MTAAEKQLRRLRKFSDLDTAIASLESEIKASKKRIAAVRDAKPAAPGKSRAERQAEDDAREADGKAAAMKRSEDFASKPRCEVYDGNSRCVETATEADHVLGGSNKEDMEALPNGEGFEAMCHTHHVLKTGNVPTGLVWLKQAKDHALRVGAKRLLPFIDRALAKYEGKHGGGR